MAFSMALAALLLAAGRASAGPAAAPVEWLGADVLERLKVMKAVPVRPEPLPLPAAGEETPLHCEPAVIEAFAKAWRMGGNGYREYEAGFRVDRIGESLEIVFAPLTYERLKLTIPILKGATIAIAHTHPDRADPLPGPRDYDSPVLNYVISRHALHVTVPGSRKHRRLRGGDWARPCPAANPK